MDWTSSVPTIREILIMTYKTFYYYFKDICKRQQKINRSDFKKIKNSLLSPPLKLLLIVFLLIFYFQQ